MKTGADGVTPATSSRADQPARDAKEKRQNNASTGASAAGGRALAARLAAWYFRIPGKFFFRSRVDYLAYPRELLFRSRTPNQSYSWRMTTTPGILAHAVKTYGWGFIPNQVLPPLLANVTIGAVLYTSYLQTLGLLYEPASQATKRMYPPPPLLSTFGAGFTAGAFQSVFAAPLDALTIRFRTADLLEQKYKSMWHYAYEKVKAIGARGVFAGWGITFVKDSLGYGAFFASFEYVKSQCFYEFVSKYYGQYGLLSIFQQQEIQKHKYRPTTERPVIKPHYLMEPAFLLLAGVTASVMQQTIQHPLTQIQELHTKRLAGLDTQMMTRPSRMQTLELYGQAYRKTMKQCAVQARRSGGWVRFLYGDFWMSTIRQVPSTSAGLIVFEIFRRKYGIGTEAARITKDGYDIELS